MLLSNNERERKYRNRNRVKSIKFNNEDKLI